MDFLTLAQQCAPAVHPQTMAAVVQVESAFNPFAIGFVGGRLQRQPRNKAEATATAKALEQAGLNFSLGIGQVNRHNLARYGLDYDSAFDPCANLRAGSLILKGACFDRALPRFKDQQQALQGALSCYYSGNFITGFRRESEVRPSYVQKVLISAGARTASVVARTSVTAEGSGDNVTSNSVYGYSNDSAMVYQQGERQ